MIERCDCGNRNFLSAVDMKGKRMYSRDVIVPARQGYVYDEQELCGLRAGDDTGV